MRYVGDVSRWLLALAVLVACDRTLGVLQVYPPEGTPADASADADPTIPRIVAPALFPEENKPEPYLFEGTGYRFASIATKTAGTHRPVPVVIEGVFGGDAVAITIPSELGLGWQICGADVAPGEHDLGALVATAPCARTEGRLGFTITVPVSFTTSAAAIVTPIALHVVRAELAFDRTIDLYPLDEIEAAVPAVSGLFAAIRMTAGWAPAKAGPAVTWRSITDVELGGMLDARGADGEHTFACVTGAGCAGGLGGPGNATHPGAPSTCTAGPCNAPTPRGGAGGMLCGTSGCTTGYTSASGGGGGGVQAGTNGKAASPACPQTVGTGGAANPDMFLPDLSNAGGGGGGAGGYTTDGSTNTRHSAGGGGGGGVVAIDALGQLRLGTTGSIDVSGGNAPASNNSYCNANSKPGEAGGGGGGAMRLRAESISASTTLDVRLLVFGGSNSSQAPSGGGGWGRVRLDALGTNPAGVPNLVQGPDFDLPSPIVATSALQLPARARSSVGTSIYWGVRAAGATSYTTDVKPVGNPAATVTLDVPLAPGLNEICVFPDALASANVADIPGALKRCTWVARI